MSDFLDKYEMRRLEREAYSLKLEQAENLLKEMQKNVHYWSLYNPYASFLDSKVSILVAYKRSNVLTFDQAWAKTYDHEAQPQNEPEHDAYRDHKEYWAKAYLVKFEYPEYGSLK